MELASELTRKIASEASKQDKRTYEDVINKIKRKGEKEIQEVLETKQLNNVDYQKFRRALGLLIKSMNTAIESIRDAADDLTDQDKSYDALTNVIDIVEYWNNLGVSLTLMGYDKLEQNDKIKINNDLQPLSPAIRRLEQYIISIGFNFGEPDLVKNALDVLSQMIEQLNTKMFKTISVPLGFVP